jgi:hypothetical protein
LLGQLCSFAAHRCDRCSIRIERNGQENLSDPIGWRNIELRLVAFIGGTQFRIAGKACRQLDQ